MTPCVPLSRELGQSSRQAGGNGSQPGQAGEGRRLLRLLPPDVALTDTDCTKLEAAAGVTFDADDRHRLAAALTVYTEDVAQWEAAPSPAEVAPAVDRVAKLAAELDGELHRLNGIAPATQAARWAIAWQDRSMDLREVHRVVGALRWAADRAAASFLADKGGQKRGPKGEPARDRLVATLEGIFRD